MCILEFYYIIVLLALPLLHASTLSVLHDVVLKVVLVEMSVNEPAPVRKYRMMRPDVLILPSIRFVLYEDVFIMCSLISRDL